MVTVIHFRLSAGGAGRAGPGPADVDAGPLKKKNKENQENQANLQLSSFLAPMLRKLTTVTIFGVWAPKCATVIHFRDPDAENGDSYTFSGPRRQKC